MGIFLLCSLAWTWILYLMSQLVTSFAWIFNLALAPISSQPCLPLICAQYGKLDTISYSWIKNLTSRIYSTHPCNKRKNTFKQCKYLIGSLPFFLIITILSQSQSFFLFLYMLLGLVRNVPIDWICNYN